MPKPVARYLATFGLSGGDMPAFVSGPLIVHTRRDLAAVIRYEIEVFQLPASAFRGVSIRKLWRHIKRHGSSSAHIHLHHGNNVLSFIGLTEDEARDMELENV